MSEDALDTTLEESVPMIQSAPRPPDHAVVRVLRTCRDFWTGSTTIPTFVVVLLAFTLLGFAIKTRQLESLPTVSVLPKEEVCRPRVVNVADINYPSGHRFYTMLKDMDPPLPLTFRGNHRILCQEKWRRKMNYKYCLPMTPRKDTPFCLAGDRTDLLSVAASPTSVCYASVLHLLLVDVYEEMKATGNTPLVVYGSLLGAVRNGSIIPFTEDTDIGYVQELRNREQLIEGLWRKGYHMFDYSIWRVCVAPTHPLAFRLYDTNSLLAKDFDVPYVDLYKMEELNNGSWKVDCFEGTNGDILPSEKIEPFSHVTINGMPFDTVHDPQYFLTESYGPDYMTPHSRTDYMTLRPRTSNEEGKPRLWEKILKALQH
ncbi:hypothetical protein PsorP6_005545 [Peronosclerospora sorghi]|uniref:Uncharacterized protein n=1 Tax=Peronosclerospora sorghi TaxID=230839 RepID=A0ACC0W7C3_9STRA|nr:hypothetical protein PsorP6_005545 [Peronosclerospora sorghi]